MANEAEEKEIMQCLRDIRMALVAAAIFVDEKATPKQRSSAHDLIMTVARQFGIEWN